MALADFQICVNANNFTEEIRKDFEHPGLARQQQLCDPQTLKESDSQWFRFSGGAGSTMLNKCPLSNSCGTQIPIWSDAELPSQVLSPKAIDAYGSTRSKGSPESFCKAMKVKFQVMRCSQEPGDIVYRFDGRVFCNMAFCSME